MTINNGIWDATIRADPPPARRADSPKIGARRGSGPRFPKITQALMLAYGMPEEIAAWEAAGRPEITKAEWNGAIHQAYVVLVPGENGELIAPNGKIRTQGAHVSAA